jgi:hypothetical protein
MDEFNKTKFVKGLTSFSSQKLWFMKNPILGHGLILEGTQIIFNLLKTSNLSRRWCLLGIIRKGSRVKMIWFL